MWCFMDVDAQYTGLLKRKLLDWKSANEKLCALSAARTPILFS